MRVCQPLIRYLRDLLALFFPSEQTPYITFIQYIMNFSLNSSLNLVILCRTPVHSDSKQALFLASRSATAPDDYQNLFREVSGLIEIKDRIVSVY